MLAVLAVLVVLASDMRSLACISRRWPGRRGRAERRQKEGGVVGTGGGVAEAGCGGAGEAIRSCLRSWSDRIM